MYEKLYCKTLVLRSEFWYNKFNKQISIHKGVKIKCQYLISAIHLTKKKDAVCTYETFHSNESVPSAEHPIMVLDNTKKQWKHHSSGVFTNPIKRTSFAFDEEEGTISADIIRIDARFTSLLRWLGENHINVRLSGENREDGYAVYKIREIAYGGGTKLSAEDGFLQFMIERLLAFGRQGKCSCRRRIVHTNRTSHRLDHGSGTFFDRIRKIFYDGRSSTKK